MDIKDFKVGETIIAVPTGNNARVNKNIVEFTVISVKRKYVELQPEGWTSTKMYDPKTGATQEAIRTGYGLNSGYKFFKDMDDYKSYQVRSELILTVKNKLILSYSNNLDKLSDKTLMLILKELDQ